MMAPNRFLELEPLESNNVLLVNDHYHSKLEKLKSQEVIIFCETLHPLLDTDIENILQTYSDRFVIFVLTRRVSSQYEENYNCKIIPVVSADMWYNKLLPKFEINFDNKVIERYFISLNNRGQWDRHALFQTVLNFNLLDYCYFSYLMTDRFGIGKQELYNQLDTITQRGWLNQNLNFETLIDKIPFIHGVDQQGITVAETNPYNMLDIEKYYKSFFSVVMETYIDSYTESFLSEKIFKPIAYGQPLLTFSSPGTLKKLKTQGFETFNLIFDESYDSEEHPSLRFEQMVKQLIDICSRSTEEITNMYSIIKPVCEHNYNHFWYNWPKEYANEIEQVKTQIEELL